jgi:hypothetical protein
MSFSDLSIVPVIIIGLTSVFILVNQNWRASILALALQYLAVFWLVGLVWPLGLAAVKLVAGWIAGAVMGASRPDVETFEDSSPAISIGLFRLIAAGLVLVLVVSILPQATAFLPVDAQVLAGGLILIGFGLLQLGMSVHPLRIILGLLTVLSGFELVYAGVETSILIAGLQALVTLGLALGGAYLLSAASMEESE